MTFMAEAEAASPWLASAASTAADLQAAPLTRTKLGHCSSVSVTQCQFCVDPFFERESLALALPFDGRAFESCGYRSPRCSRGWRRTFMALVELKICCCFGRTALERWIDHGDHHKAADERVRYCVQGVSE